MNRFSLVLFALLWGVCIAPAMVWAIVEFVGSLKRKPVKYPPPTVASTGVLVLKPDKGPVAFMLTFIGMLMTMGIILFVYFAGGYAPSEERLTGLIYSLGTIFCGIYVLIQLRYQLILEPDAITLVCIFRTKRLLREEIRGKRLLVGGLGLYKLYPKQADKEKIKVRFWYDDHGEIKNWLSDIPWIGKPPFSFQRQ